MPNRRQTMSTRPGVLVFTLGPVPASRCGAGRIRTDDIRLAKAALYQLSYGPPFRVGDGGPGRT